ncbi:4Fe-4S binding protein [Patescibacteria group bacterium]
MKNFKPITVANQKKKVTLFLGLCKGCGLCLEKCPFGAISFSKDKVGVYGTPSVEIDIKKCTFCGICETTCPDLALRVDK